MTAPPRVLVIGGGISGLACALRLDSLRVPALLAEHGARFGGVLDTLEKNNFLFDIGPQSFLLTPPLQSLIAGLGLAGQLLRANPRSPRYIYLHGKLHPVPLHPLALLATPLLGWRTKLRLLAEPFARTRPPACDESVAAFIRRKFGPDLLANLVAPFISGIYAGDPEWLSLQSTFPILHQAEQESGSLVRGMLRLRKSRARHERPKRPALCNFRNGLASFTAALAAKLGDSARINTAAAMLGPAYGSEGPGFHVALSANGAIQPLRVSAVVLAVPAPAAARLLQSLDSRFPDILQRIGYAPVAQVNAGYRLADLRAPQLRRRGGFGFLVPRRQGLRSLGTVFNSFLFPNRAPGSPEPMASFTTFFGGATDHDICRSAPEEIAAAAHAELSQVLGMARAPVVQNVSLWERALPQYNLGHAEIVRSLGELCSRHPGIFLAGNYLHGPSIGACVEHAGAVAEEVARFCG